MNRARRMDTWLAGRLLWLVLGSGGAGAAILSAAQTGRAWTWLLAAAAAALALLAGWELMRNRSQAFLPRKQEGRNPVSSEMLRAAQFIDRVQEDRRNGVGIVLTTPEEIALYDDLKKRVNAEMVRRGLRRPDEKEQDV